MRPGAADEARQEPGEAVFGGEAEFAVGSGELRARGGESDIGVAGDDKPDTGGGAVDGRDDGLGEAEVEREVLVELGADSESGPGNIDGDAGIVATFFDVTFERLGVGAGTEAAAGPCKYHDADPGILFRLLEAPAVLSVHAAGPRVQAVRAVQRDGRDAVGDLEGGGLEFHPHIVARPFTGTPLR